MSLTSAPAHPDRGIETVEELESLLSEPSSAAIAAVSRLTGTLLILGVAGKMGPTLARMAKRATDTAGNRLRVIGVSRFSTTGSQEGLRQDGIETIPCDLLNENSVSQLPNAENVVFMAGMKFGSTGGESTTWAMNAYLPGLVCNRFRKSRMVAFSTGNVYGLASIERGSLETDSLNPLGEYAMSCLGRERILEHFSRVHQTPMAILRLNYACELRYGVLIDLAQKIWRDEPIDLAMGYFNILWQGDANAMALAAFDHLSSPPNTINLTGPERLEVRSVCEQLGRRMSRSPRFLGEPGKTALLSDATRALRCLGPTRIAADQLIEWAALWVMRGGALLGKPTRFESRDGRF